MRTALLAALVACGTAADESGSTLSGTASGDPTTTTTTTGSTTTTTGTTGYTQTTTWACRSDIPDGDLNGNYPGAELALPEFLAYNSDGTERHKPDLQGHVTVLWFYPAAGTGG